MQDYALNLLFDEWQKNNAQGNSLWFADENSHEILPKLATASKNLTIVSNRYDIHSIAQKLGLRSFFNDVDFSVVGTQTVDHLFIRISKEKSVTHHAINQALKTVTPIGNMYLAGYKNEGIKTYAQKASAFFNSAGALIKHKDAHCICLNTPRISSERAFLDDNNYTALRTIGEYQGAQLISKPGVFGYEKIDEGSALLLSCAKKYLDTHTLKPEKILDLGCGYGLLSLISAQWRPSEIIATDNNAAALNALKAGATTNNIALSIVADDVGEKITGKFDTLLCNPPFHKGFSVSGDLTDKFLRSASHRLSKNGVAFFVVNSFIGIEKKAEMFFSRQELLINNKHFKVFAFKK